VTTAGPSRKQARRDAVFLLYQTDATDQTMAELVEGQRLREGYGPDEFTIAAVSGVLAAKQELDAVLDTPPMRPAPSSTAFWAPSPATGRKPMADVPQAEGVELTRAQALARLREILGQLEELEPRLAASSSAEVEMTLLERATEQVEEAGRLLEQLGRVAG